MFRRRVLSPRQLWSPRRHGFLLSRQIAIRCQGLSSPSPPIVTAAYEVAVPSVWRMTGVSKTVRAVAKSSCWGGSPSAPIPRCLVLGSLFSLQDEPKGSLETDIPHPGWEHRGTCAGREDLCPGARASLSPLDRPPPLASGLGQMLLQCASRQMPF